MPLPAQAPMPRLEQDRWRERPRFARCKWPRACPEGSLTPWLSVSCVVRLSVCGRSGIAANQVHMSRGTKRRSSGQSGPARAGNPGHKSPWFRARSRDRSGVGGEHDLCTLPATHQSKELHLVGCADHHVFDTGSVLGIVQGSSLRSARACARPAGLDDACAQIGLGNYVMSGTCALGSVHTVAIRSARNWPSRRLSSNRDAFSRSIRSSYGETASCVRYSDRRTCCRNVAACCSTTELAAFGTMARVAHVVAPEDAANRTLRINWKLGPRSGHASPRRCSTNTWSWKNARPRRQYERAPRLPSAISSRQFADVFVFLSEPGPKKPWHCSGNCPHDPNPSSASAMNFDSMHTALDADRQKTSTEVGVTRPDSSST